MMMLVVDGTSLGIRCSNVVYWVNDYESAFELLTELVAGRWTLAQAILIDGRTRTILPIEAFDGQSFQGPISNLQQQWQQILASRPVMLPILGIFPLKDWFYRLDAYYYQQLTLLSKISLVLEAAIKKPSTTSDQSFRLRLQEQYRRLRESNRRMLNQTKVCQQKNRDRLTKLENR